jgi:hypothetical protein
MEGRNKKVSQQMSMLRPVVPREYNELLHILAVKNRIIDDITFECNNCRGNISVEKLRKILSGS